MTITTDNYEEYFYRYCEGELTAAEHAAVEAFATAHPQLAQELSLYDPALKAEPEPVVFPDKASLTRHTPVPLPVWRWAAAACVATLLLVGVWQFVGNRPQQPAIAGLPPISVPTIADTMSVRTPLPVGAVAARQPSVVPAPTPAIPGTTVADPVPPIHVHVAVLDEPLIAEAVAPDKPLATTETTVIIYTDFLLLPEESVAMAEVDTVEAGSSLIDNWLTIGRTTYDRLRAQTLRLEGEARAMLASL